MEHFNRGQPPPTTGSRPLPACATQTSERFLRLSPPFLSQRDPAGRLPTRRLVGNHEGCPYKCKIARAEGAFPRRSPKHFAQKRPKGPLGTTACCHHRVSSAEKQPPPECVLSHARLPARSAPACALHADRQAGRQAGRRPSFSAYFLGEQRMSTCRFTSSAFLPLSSQERGPGG